MDEIILNQLVDSNPKLVNIIVKFESAHDL